MNPYLEARISPQTIYVPELGRKVPTFHCSVEIHDPLFVARKDFIDYLSRNFTLRIGDSFLTATVCIKFMTLVKINLHSIDSTRLDFDKKSINYVLKDITRCDL